MSRSSKAQARYDAWVKQAGWIVEFLERLQLAPSAHGIKWTRRMVEHYNYRYTLHHTRMPLGCKKQAGVFKQRINKVLVWLEEQS